MTGDRQDTSPTSDLVSNLAQLAALHGQGSLSDEEFSAAKQQILSERPAQQPLPSSPSAVSPVATPVLSDETGHLDPTESGTDSGSDGDDREIGYRLNGGDQHRVDAMLDELDELGIPFRAEADWIYVPAYLEPEVDQLVETLTGIAPDEDFSAAKQRTLSEKPAKQKPPSSPSAVPQPPLTMFSQRPSEIEVKRAASASEKPSQQPPSSPSAVPPTPFDKRVLAYEAAGKEPSANEYDQNVVWNAVVAGRKERRAEKAARKERRADRLVEPSTRFGWPMNVGLAAGAITFVNSASRWPNPATYADLVGSLVEGASGYVAVGGNLLVSESRSAEDAKVNATGDRPASTIKEAATACHVSTILF